MGLVIIYIATIRRYWWSHYGACMEMVTPSGIRLLCNVSMWSYQYQNSHYTDKTILGPLYIFIMGITVPVKAISFCNQPHVVLTLSLEFYFLCHLWMFIQGTGIQQPKTVANCIWISATHPKLKFGEKFIFNALPNCTILLHLCTKYDSVTDLATEIKNKDDPDFAQFEFAIRVEWISEFPTAPWSGSPYSFTK